MKKMFLLFALSLSMLWGKDKLTVFSGAGLIKPMNEIIQDFEKKFDAKVDVYYDGSGNLYGRYVAGQPCDVYVPGSEKALNDMIKKGWIVEPSVQKIVLHIPVIAIPADNPAEIKGIKDFARKGVKLALGAEKGPAIGKLSKMIFQKNEIYDDVRKNVSVETAAVNQLLIYITQKTVDATIIWEDMASWAESQGKIKTIPIEKNVIKTVPSAITKKSKNKELAEKFNKYLKERKDIWEKWNFKMAN